MAEELDFEITTALRSDGILLGDGQGSDEINAFLATNGSGRGPCQFYMLRYHRDRMQAALLAFNRPYNFLEGSTGLQYLEGQLHDHLLETYGDPNYCSPLKLRVSISVNGQMQVQSSPTPPCPLYSLFPGYLSPSTQPTFRVFICPLPSTADLFTIHKTSNRNQYDTVRCLLPPSSASDLPSEIILVNDQGNIIEGSITTPYFHRNGEWVTPVASLGGNLGTTRRFAIQHGLCSEGFVHKDSVQVGEAVVLSNGVRGWGWGRLELLG